MKYFLSDIYQSLFDDGHHSLVSAVRRALALNGGLTNEECQFDHQFMDPEADLTASNHQSFEITSITEDGTVEGEYFWGTQCSHDIENLQPGELISILKVVERTLEGKGE